MKELEDLFEYLFDLLLEKWIIKEEIGTREKLKC